MKISEKNILQNKTEIKKGTILLNEQASMIKVCTVTKRKRCWKNGFPLTMKFFLMLTEE
jgi:hypothetical protein